MSFQRGPQGLSKFYQSPSVLTKRLYWWLGFHSQQEILPHRSLFPCAYNRNLLAYLFMIAKHV